MIVILKSSIATWKTLRPLKDPQASRVVRSNVYCWNHSHWFLCESSTVASRSPTDCVEDTTHLQKLAVLEFNCKTCLTSKTNTFLMADVLHVQFLCHTQFHYQLANVCRQVGILFVTYLQLTQLAIAKGVFWCGSISRYQLLATAHSQIWNECMFKNIIRCWMSCEVSAGHWWQSAGTSILLATGKKGNFN